jgi:hypothetical protein
MEETVKNELDALIQEQKERIPKLIIREGDFFTYYVYDTYIEEEYIKWKENTKRFLEINFIGDKHIDEFNKTCDEKELAPNQQKKLLAILEAFKKYPQIIESKKTTNRGSNINISNNINNTNTQSQSQQQGIKILIKSLEDELSVSQLKALKQIIEKEGDLKKAKPELIDKIKSFGKDVASNILANIITNPAIWSYLG